MENGKLKLPFKCLNCGKIGHFVAKCPYPKNEDSGDEDHHNYKENKKRYKRRKAGNKKRFHKQKKSLYSKEDSSSYDENDDDAMEALFMCLESQDDVIDNGNKIMKMKKI